MDMLLKILSEMLPTSVILAGTFWLAKRYYEKNIEDAIKEATTAAKSAHDAVIASENRSQTFAAKIMEMQSALSAHFMTQVTRVETVERKLDIIGTQIQGQKLSLKRKKQNAGH